MKQRTQFTLMISALLVTFAARSQVPDYILSAEPSRAGGTNLQIAVFTYKDKKIGFALGCVELAKRWTGVTQRKVAPIKWNEEVKSANVVADIDCTETVFRDGANTEGSTKKFQSKGEPGSFVIKYRDGKRHLHFVDNVEWFKAIAGPVPSTTPDALRAMVVDRGPDFKSKIAPKKQNPGPGPGPGPSTPTGPNQPPTFTSYWSGSYFFIDAKNPGKAVSCNYKFTFAYDDYGSRKQRTETGSFGLRAGFSGNAVKFAGAWVNPAKDGEPSIQCY